MKWAAATVLVLAVAAPLLWWWHGQQSHQVQPVSGVERSEPAVAVTSSQRSLLPAPPGSLPMASIRPAEAGQQRHRGWLEAVRNANSGVDPFPELLALAEQGNGHAAVAVAHMLTRCLRAPLDVLQGNVERRRSKRAEARQDLRRLRQGPASAASVAAAEDRLARADGSVTAELSQLRVCQDHSQDKFWASLAWYERARRMGLDSAMGQYLKRLDELFRDARMVGRDPQRALYWRGRARTYLRSMLEHCTRHV